MQQLYCSNVTICRGQRVFGPVTGTVDEARAVGYCQVCITELAARAQKLTAAV